MTQTIPTTLIQPLCRQRTVTNSSKKPPETLLPLSRTIILILFKAATPFGPPQRYKIRPLQALRLWPPQPLTSSASSRSRSPSRSAHGSSHEIRERPPLPAKWFDKTIVEQVDSSWIEELGQHGRRRKRLNPEGKEVVIRTKIEEAMTRSKKNEIIKAKGHWFGRLHHFRFNPYTTDQDLIKKPGLTTFARPFAQPGRGTNNLQNAIGLKDDRDMFNDIRYHSHQSTCRKLCAKHTKAGPGSPLNWQNLPSSQKSTLNGSMLKEYPFLVHFRDEDGDCWAVKMLIQSFLGGNKAHQKRTLDVQHEKEDRRRQPHISAIQVAARKKAIKVVEKERERETRREAYNKELKNAPTPAQRKSKVTNPRPNKKIPKRLSNVIKNTDKGKGKAPEVDNGKRPVAQRGPKTRNSLRESTAGPSNSTASKAAPKPTTTRSIKKRKMQDIETDPK
ncbi:hypothetical protein BDV93DRAFT_513355 [Ceratobasidium sp. AG-I]|nr:hypothetical protein BDV93DRAFT_513355 [Ceratobasidium sp. AG-I]